MEDLIFLAVIVSSIWVAFDASKVMAGLTKQQRIAVSKHGGRSPLGWCIGCLLLWIVVFPNHTLAQVSVEEANERLAEKQRQRLLHPVSQPATQVVQKKAIEHYLLGVRIASVDAIKKNGNKHLKKILPKKASGIVVMGVVLASDAEKCGIKVGDIITKINSSAVFDLESIGKAIGSVSVGQILRIDIMRLTDADGWKQLPIQVHCSVPSQALINEITCENGSSIIKIEQTDHGSVWVEANSTIVYLDNQPDMIYEFCEVYFKENGVEYKNPSGHFYSIGGKPAKLELLATDSKIVIHDDPKLGYIFEFKDVGESGFDISIDNKLIHYPLAIVKSPIHVGTAADEVVKQLGLPSDKEKHYVSWPDCNTYDNIIYNPTASERIVSPEHWRFDKFSNLVIAIEDGKVCHISSYDKKGVDSRFDSFHKWSN